MRISKSNLFILLFIIGTYIIWFVFFQDVIQFILENAIEVDTGEKDIVTGWIGVFFFTFTYRILFNGNSCWDLHTNKKNKEK